MSISALSDWALRNLYIVYREVKTALAITINQEKIALPLPSDSGSWSSNEIRHDEHQASKHLDVRHSPLGNQLKAMENFEALVEKWLQRHVQDKEDEDGQQAPRQLRGLSRIH